MARTPRTGASRPRTAAIQPRLPLAAVPAVPAAPGEVAAEPWRIDDRQRAAGRRGLAQARAALAAATQKAERRDAGRRSKAA